MIQSNQISTISELRFKTALVLKKIKEAPVYLFHHSNPTAVMMSVTKYQQMQEALEDYYLSLKAVEYETEDKKSVKWIKDTKMQELLKEK